MTRSEPPGRRDITPGDCAKQTPHTSYGAELRRLVTDELLPSLVETTKPGSRSVLFYLGTDEAGSVSKQIVRTVLWQRPLEKAILPAPQAIRLSSHPAISLSRGGISQYSGAIDSRCSGLRSISLDKGSQPQAANQS